MRQVPTVVVATDHPAEQALIRYWLSRRGMTALAMPARPGAGALAALAPDLVFLDAGDEPIEEVRALKARLPGAAIALLTKRPISVPEADVVLRRPFDLRSLTERVAPLLDERTPVAEARAPARTKRVLICDDDEDFVRAATAVFVNAGCEVIAALDANTFLERLPDLRGVDLALVDLRMPGINGLQVCRFLRDRAGDDLRICMITATHDPENLGYAEQAGADGWLNKPLAGRELLALVGLEPRGAASPPAGAFAAPRKAAGPRSIAATAATTDVRRKRVLVIDDDPAIVEFCTRVLRGAGADVDAADPERLRHSEMPVPGSYDIVLVDLNLGVQSGLEVMKALVADVRNVASRLYVITATEADELGAEATRSGADGWLKKPLAPKDLIALL